MLRSLRFVLSCAGCGRDMGEVSAEEFWELSDDGSVNGLCFDCDPESANTTPSFFWQWSENELFDIGDMSFQVRGNKLEVIGGAQSRAHESTRARGLSSYTYLNRTPKRQSVLRNGLQVEVCPDCGGRAELLRDGYLVDCDRCASWGSKVNAIFLPLWIIEEGENDV